MSDKHAVPGVKETEMEIIITFVAVFAVGIAAKNLVVNHAQERAGYRAAMAARLVPQEGQRPQ